MPPQLSADKPVEKLTVGLCAAGEIWGGVELALQLLAKGLRSRDIEIVAILFSEGLLAERLRAEGIPCVVIQMPHKYSMAGPRAVAAELTNRNIGLLHVHGYKAGVVGGLAGARVSIPVVKTEHGEVEGPGDWREIAGWMRLLAYRSLDRAITRRVADAVVAVSSDMASSLSRRLGSRVRLIHNGIPLPPLPAGRKAHQGFRLGIVGRLTTVKGHPTLFEAVRLLQDGAVSVDVIGTGPRDEEYRSIVDAAGLQSQITFKGFRKNVRAELEELDALVMPSMNEGLPFALLEAMALGLPVIASAVGGIRDVVEHEVSGLLVPPSDAAALSKAISRLRHDPPLTARLGEAARRRIEAAFDAERMIDEHVRLYRGVVEQHASVRPS